MKIFRLIQWLMVGVILSLPVAALAQEASLSGTVKDSTGGALPGVTVRAVHEASGNNFEAVTDERGEFRLALRVGVYKITGELQGFGSIDRSLTLLVGQQAVVDLTMAVSGVQESVTVTGEAPLLEVTDSSLGSNIDPRQMQELPIQGRNWMDLVMLAPGSRANNASGFGAAPIFNEGKSAAVGNFQFNIDGQQATAFVAGGQPQFSREALAEFEFLSGRFDASQGRSTGVQVNAVTKSGTNAVSGSVGGYFRDDKFNSSDPVANRVLPYQNQQFASTLGGPVKRDRIHLFGHYEHEREPSVSVFTIPYPTLLHDLEYTRTQQLGGLRLDAQVSGQTRFMARVLTFDTLRIQTAGLGTSAPNASGQTRNASTQAQTTTTQVFGSRLVNEVKVGYVTFRRDQPFVAQYLADLGMVRPRLAVVLPGATLGGEAFSPANSKVEGYNFRDDLTYSFAKGGNHTLKVGAEYFPQWMYDWRCILCDGRLDASITPAATITPLVPTLFPDQFNVRSWNLNPLSPYVTTFTQNFAESNEFFASTIPRHSLATWAQDDWTRGSLTMNLGVRYDLELNAFTNDVAFLPFRPGNQPEDMNNVAPRVGFAYSVNDRTVLRGGYGLFFGTSNNGHYTKLAGRTFTLTLRNDGRPDFATNPYNGPTPSFQEISARFCTAAAPFAPGCIRRATNNTGGGYIYAPGYTMQYAHQASMGFQRQIGPVMSIEGDYVYTGNRNFPYEQIVNLSYDPATGVNYPFSDITRRPFPNWDLVTLSFNGYRSNYHGMQLVFTKRWSNKWQASGNYLLSAYKDAVPKPVMWNGSSFQTVPFDVPPDLGGEYAYAINDQRHRLVANGIMELPFGFQVSGLYFFGSGARFDTRWGTDVRGLGSFIFGDQRLRPNGTIVPRNNFVGKPIHRVDMRLQRRFPIVGRAAVDGMVEVFNLFNHKNFGAYQTREVSATTYGRPTQVSDVAFSPRTLQLGFKFTF